jgi:hypothetical protein
VWSAVLAFIADLTSEGQRTKAMEMVGGSIGVSFSDILHNVELLRLNFGVLVLHATQTALFLVVPRILEAGGLPVASHWKVYLPVMGLSFVMMVPANIAAR